MSCTATWLVTPLQRSSGGMPRSIEPTPSSSCGTELASVGYLSTRPTAPMGLVCSASRASHWRTLGPMSAGPATTPGAMTSDKTQPSPGSVPRPPFRCYRNQRSVPLIRSSCQWTPLANQLPCSVTSPLPTLPTRKASG